MSPHAANSLVHDLVQMAQAMEQLPQVQAQLDRTQGDLDHAYATIQRLELKLIERANQIDTLNASLRAAEVAKDQAETMFLEADERTARALDFVKTMFGSAGSLIQALEPPKPEPMPEPTPTVVFTGEPANIDSVTQAVPEGQHVEGSQSAVDPIPTTSSAPSTTGTSENALGLSAEVSATVVSEGVSVPSDPTPTMETSSENVSNVSAQPEGQSATDPTAAPEPQTGTGTESAALGSDPEPSERWSNEWWQWKDRQSNAKAAE